MHKRGQVILLCLLLFVFSASAQEEVWGPTADDLIETGLSLRQERINEMYKAFDYNDGAKALEIIAQNPDFMNLPLVQEAVAEALKLKALEVAKVLNTDKGTELLVKNDNVREAYSKAATKDVQVLNIAPKAKET